MKILKISGLNLASIAREFTIDFEEERFKNSGLFAITGDTGSGKTTILDAISLALYGSTPRYKNAYTGVIKSEDGTQDMAQSSPINILTKGQKKGYAEVIFLGKNGQKYRARWEAQFKRTNFKEEMLFENLTTGEKVNKKTEVKNLVEKVIGLTMEQFNQVVLLPQGGFSDFLKAKPSERANLLEQITGLSIYKWLSQRAFEKAKDSSVEIDKIKSLASSLTIISDEEKIALKNKLNEIRENITDLTNKDTQIKDYDKVLNELANIKTQINQISQTLINRENSPEFQEIKKQEVIALERVRYNEFANDYNDLKTNEHKLKELDIKEKSNQEESLNLNNELDRLNEELSNAQKTYENLVNEQKDNQKNVKDAKGLDNQISQKNNEKQKILAQKNTITKEYENNSQSLKTLNDELAQKEAQLKNIKDDILNNAKYQDLNNLENIKQNLDSFINEIKEIKAKNQKFANSKKEEDKLIKQKDKLVEENAQNKEDAQKLNDESKALKERINELKKEGVDKVLPKLYNQRTTLKSVDLVVKNLPKKLDAILKTTDKLQKTQEEILSIQNEIKVTNDEVTKNEESYQLLKNKLDNQKIIQSLENYRNTLEDGKPCPLCGAIHHPDIDKLKTTLDLTKLQNEVDEENKKLEDSKTRLNDLNNKNQIKHSSIDTLQTNLEDKKNEYFNEINEIVKAISEVDSNFNFRVNEKENLNHEELIKTYKDLVSKIDSKITLNEESLENQKSLEAQYDALIKKLEALNLKLSSYEENVKEINESLAKINLSLIEQDIKNHQNLKEIYEKNLEDSLGKILNWQEELLVNINNLELKEDGAQNILNKLNQGLNKYKDSKEQEIKLTQDLDKINKEIIAKDTIIKQQKDNLDNVNKELKSVDDDLHDFENQRKLLLKGLSVDEFLEKEAKAINDANNKKIKLDKDLISVTSKIDNLEKNIKEILDEKKNTQTQINEKNNLIDSICLNLNTSKDHFIEILELSKDEISKINEKVKAFQEETKALVDNKNLNISKQNDIIQKINEEKDKFPKEYFDENGEIFQEVKESLAQDLQELKTNLEDVSHKIKQDDENKVQYDEYFKKIEDIKSKNKKWVELNDLIGRADGSKFSRYAQGITFDILLKRANYYLRDFIPRYELRRAIDKENNLLVSVIDHESADAIRPSSSISGGELFMSSLSLAIALSDITSGSNRIESLFIDEGFATLDPDSLDKVMSVLEKLNRHGRTIGIISHLESIPQRVNTQIALERLPDEPSLSKVVIYPQ